MVVRGAIAKQSLTVYVNKQILHSTLQESIFSTRLKIYGPALLFAIKGPKQNTHNHIFTT